MPIPQLHHYQTPKKKPPLPARHWRQQRASGRNFDILNRFKQLPLLRWFFLLVGLTAAAFFLLLLFFFITLPSPEKLMERQVAESTKIYDREGKTILYEIHGEQKRTSVPLEQIPKTVQQAAIAIEDKDFYQHKGFSLWAIFRTAVTDIVMRRKAGGSTLTQQLVKNAFLTNEKSFIRKIKEVVLAYKLEKRFNKEEILQMYLNEIPYGSSNYGVESASKFYFGKSIQEVDLAESAILAALPQAPSRYSPYGPNKALLLGRQKYILDQMVKQGYIEEWEAAAAKETEVKFQPRLQGIIAPHFVMYIKQLLEEKYGVKEVEQGGLKIYTTLDMEKQTAAEKIVKEQALKNEKNFNAKNAALVSLDPKTGEILAMVGSRDYFDDAVDGQVNVTLQPRQPGSSFKPIVYAAAFQRGFTPDTQVYDVLTNFSTDAAKKYEPRNYDGNEHGPVSFRAALAGSLNISAVKVMYLAGVDQVVKLAQALNYSTLRDADKDRLGLSMVLGGGEVKLLEHTAAFSAFATEGSVPKIIAVRKIENRQGDILEEFKEPETKKVLEPNIARMINSILSDNAARAYVFGANNHLTLPDRQVAAKTGTTNDYRDAWTIGYTPSLVTGVWVGNNNNLEMKRGADGSQIAAPIWKAFMREAVAKMPVENFNSYTIDPKTPAILLGQGFGKQIVKIDKASGLLATDNTPETFIIEKSYLQPHSLLYFIDKNNPLGGAPKNPGADPQFALWETGVQNWIERQQAKDPNFSTEQPPTDYDNAHSSELRPIFSVIGLSNGELITQPLPSIAINASAPRGVKRAEYLINDLTFAASYEAPFSLNRPLSLMPNGAHKITVKVCDDLDNCSTQNFNISLQLNQTFTNPFSLSWVEPKNNASVLEKNLPITLKININNPDSVAQIKFFAQEPNKSEPTLLNAKKMVRASSEQITWRPDAFSENIFIFWAEAEGWNGQTKSTEKISVNLKLQ